MATSPIILIAAAELVAGLRTEASFQEHVLVFADTDLDAAFRAMMDRYPTLLVVQRELLDTARGAGLVGRIRTDPALWHLEIRVLSDVRAYVQLASRQGQAGLDAATAVPGERLPAEYGDGQWAHRLQISATVQVQVDGHLARFADLSQTGAQLLLPTPLRLNQQVNLEMTDRQQRLRLRGKVIWASFEPPSGRDEPPHYRVGVRFIDADLKAVEAFGTRNRQR